MNAPGPIKVENGQTVPPHEIDHKKKIASSKTNQSKFYRKVFSKKKLPHDEPGPTGEHRDGNIQEGSRQDCILR
jgi:hypothetical protein